MEILKASPSDLVEVMFLVRECVIQMNADGMKQWNSAYPSPQMLQEEIENGNLYLAKEMGVARGLLTITDKIPESYKDIKWSDKGTKVLYIELLAVHPNWQGKGITKMLLDYANSFAKENNYDTIRTGLLSEHPLIKRLIENDTFEKTGEYYSVYQKTPYQSFEKNVS